MTSPSPRIKRVLAPCVALVVMASVWGGGIQASAQTTPDQTSESTEDYELDIEAATPDEVRAQLGSLEAERDEAQAALDSAQRHQDQAAQKLREAEEANKEAQQLVDFWNQLAKEAAIGAYVDGNNNSQMGYVLSEDIYEVAAKSVFYEFEADRRYNILEEQEKAQENLQVTLAASERLSDEANKAAESAQTVLVDLDTAVTRQATLLANVEARYDRALGEAAALETQFGQTAGEVQAAEQALYDDVVTAVPASNSPSSSPASKPSAPSTSGSSSSSAAPSSPTTTKPATTPSQPTPSQPTPTLPVVATVWVRGIQVATSIGSQTEAMLAAAQRDGISLSGSGYRDSKRQVEIRAANCGTSFYALYEMPASQCSPPTAIPGRSMHEKGLALDLTCSGTLIRSRDNTCFTWLSRNASAYGFYNLPSEPWHWSTTGS